MSGRRTQAVAAALLGVQKAYHDFCKVGLGNDNAHLVANAILLRAVQDLIVAMAARNFSSEGKRKSEAVEVAKRIADSYNVFMQSIWELTQAKEEAN